MPSDLYGQIDVIADGLAAKGIRLDRPFRRRDKDEPGRVPKEQFEDQLAKAWRKLFLRQRSEVLGQIEKIGRPGLVLSLGALEMGDYEARAGILLVLHEASQHAIELFAAEALIGLDLTVYQGMAAEHVRNTIGQMISSIDETTLELVRKAVQAYVENPGMTLGQLADQLPFDARRAQMIARTEITQVYGQINKLAGEKLAEEFADVTVVETWHTNKDDLVCPICGGLDGVEREPGQPFIHKVTGEEFDSSEDTHPECRCWTAVRTMILRKKT